MVKRPAMKIPHVCLCITLLALSSFGVEPPGRWITPDPNGKPWKHKPTSLAFPVMLGGYRLAGEFKYEQGGGCFIRYENLEERARGDIFFFPTQGKVTTMEAKQGLILQEMDGVMNDLRAMSKEGRYKNLEIGELGAAGIDLWLKEDLPLAVRVCTMTRVAQTKEGTEQVQIKQWVGITVLDDHIVTIRQMRPTSTGDDGEAGLKNFASMVIQVIKDPPLRAGLNEMIDLYMADPFSEDSIQATGAVLAYLKNTPFYPINIPEYPVQDWLAHCQKQAPGTEEQLLSAFMLGSAKAAFAEGDARTCLNAGAKQFAIIYQKLLAKHPNIAVPELPQFLPEALKGTGGDWLLTYAGIRQ